ncbi:unnamed protein product, partial [Schistocephalus solidus]|uniref:FUN14 domain-containing protein 1 n=1 Tax=Schistocephalus solidus TaxID=70667 RepID=A0A183TK05_SCHSO
MDSALSADNALAGRISTTIEALSRVLRENTAYTYTRLTRTVAVYSVSAFTAGFALGITVGVLVQRLLRDRNDILEHQIEAIRNEIAALRADSERRPDLRRPSSATFEAYIANEDEEEDEFFEARSNGSSDSADFLSAGYSARGFYTSPSASSLSGYTVSKCLSSTSLPAEVALELDALAEAALHPLRQVSVENGEDSSAYNIAAASRAFARCLVYKKQHVDIIAGTEFQHDLFRDKLLGISNQMTEKLEDLHAPDDNATVETRWCQLRNVIQCTAIEVLGRSRRQHQDWFDDNDADISNLLTEKNGLHKAYMKIRTDATKAAFFKCRRLIQQRLREMQDAWMIRKAKEIQGDAGHNEMKNFFKAIKAIYGPCIKGTAP